jgi:multidrug efflux pump subunit AcrA (membrane-fusion protein)
MGKVTRINPSVDSSTRAFQVETGVPNGEAALRPGGFAKASIVVKRNDAAFTVPIESVVRFSGITKIFVVSDDLKARAIPVETGIDEAGWIEILTPLPPKAKVVTTGQSQLAEGTEVVIRDPHAAPAAATTASTKPTGPTPAPAK